MNEQTTVVESPPADAPTAPPRRFRLHHAGLLLLVFAAAVAARARFFSGSTQASTAGEAQSVVVPLVAPENTPAESPSPADGVATPTTGPSLFGSWRDQYYGERTMTFRPDGSGTMLIKLDAVGRAIYGEKLLFELAWENRGGVLVMEFTGGEPKDAVATISKIWGARHEQKIELLTDEELHLRSTDSNNLYTLKRLPDAD
jgi:hypothetical protein